MVESLSKYPETRKVKNTKLVSLDDNVDFIDDGPYELKKEYSQLFKNKG